MTKANCMTLPTMSQRRCFFFSFNLQADTSSDSHSLHITLSTYQKNAWIDFMEKVCLVRVKIYAMIKESS